MRVAGLHPERDVLLIPGVERAHRLEVPELLFQRAALGRYGAGLQGKSVRERPSGVVEFLDEVEGAPVPVGLDRVDGRISP